MSTAASRRRLNHAIASFSHFVRSPNLDALHARESGVDLNFAAFRVLVEIARHGPLDLGRLAMITHLAPNALSRQLKVLEGNGFIARRASDDDGRVMYVEVTPTGRDAEQRLRAANDRMLARQLRGWTTAELDHLSAQIDRLVADLRGYRV